MDTSRRARQVLAIGVLASCCGCRTPAQIERDYAKKLTPASLEGDRTEPASADSRPPARKLRLRVYADLEYRAESVTWDQSVEKQIRRASMVTENQFGVTLVLESLRRWDARNSSGSLEDALNALKRLDAGTGVDWVMGLVASMPIVTASQDMLGLAYPFGQHFVLRGMRNAGESDDLQAALKHLSDRERDALIRERRMHRLAAVLLHEWGHALGAFHGRSPDFLMCGTYHPKQARFPDETTNVIAIGLRYQRGRPLKVEELEKWATELRDYVKATSWNGWDAHSRDAHLHWAEEIIQRKEHVASGGASASPLAGPDRERLEAAEKAERDGQYAQALQQLSPLIERLPDNGQVQTFGCQLTLRNSPNAPATLVQCRRAVSSTPQSSLPLLMLGQAELNADEENAGREHLVKGRELLEAEPQPEQFRWVYLASLFRQASCVSWSEQAADRAGDSEELRSIREWARLTRRWMGLAPNSAKCGLTPEREADYVSTMRQAQEELEKGKVARAEQRQATLSKEFPGAPGPLTLQCALHLRSGRPKLAKSACERAIHAYDEALQARYLLAIACTAMGNFDAAAAQLSRLIELDPTPEESWRMLASIYQSARRQRELTDLRTRYQLQFSRAFR